MTDKFPRVIAISDLHGYLPHDIPPCDVLIIAGDICPHFDKKGGSMRDVGGQSNWLNITFRAWLKKVPAKHVIAIWGNHDFVGQHREMVPSLNWTLLEDSETTVAGLKIYGTPWTTRFYDWAFMMPEEQLADKFAYISEGVDILVSHGPPLWVCDLTHRSDHAGSESLYKRLLFMSNPPKIVICGHIHPARGTALMTRPSDDPRWHPESLWVWNVSSVDETYSPHEPMWTEIQL